MGLALTSLVVGCGTGNGGNATNGSGTSANGTSGGGSSQNVTLNETGSSLLYPLFNNQWVQAYQHTAPNVRLNAASTGSGTGISQAVQGTVQIGASDAYLPPSMLSSNQGVMNIPLAISAQQVMYNLPGVTGHLKLTGDVLAKIYQGQIKYWDNSALTALNPGVKLPHQQIIPVHRSDGSGDTFLFTQFLTDTNASWANTVKYSTQVSWPSLSTGIGANGNDGVVTTLAGNPYSLGYVGISWLNKAEQKGLGYAALQNKAGNFLLPEAVNIQAAVNEMVSQVPTNEAISLIYAPGAKSYPIINFEYAIVKQQQADPATATALKKFLTWAISTSGGDSAQYMTPVHFLPLPTSVAPKSQAQINQITG
ncbi:phosphate ABC transporter substrate-binding protein PstS [Alicyclobacillaceae bacterium I2511]|nr:phosphate ABC transporter substrate-binding protein PstS [Alicyclobacillaceae bacterium I2511]